MHQLTKEIDYEIYDAQGREIPPSQARRGAMEIIDILIFAVCSALVGYYFGYMHGVRDTKKGFDP